MNDFSPNTLKLLKQRYLLPNETWSELCLRNVGNVIKNDETFHYQMYQLLHDRVFLPNSPGLFNAGKVNGGLFACFTAGIEEDTLESIFDSVRDIGLVAKQGGGCGFTGSNIRAKGLPVNGSAHGYALGPNAVAESISFVMNRITQNGKRGMALMYTLSADHPDIEEFLHLKQTADDKACSNFNQSVFVTDAWLNLALTHLGSKEEYLFDLIAKHAHNNGEPGLLFETTINENTPYKFSNQYIQTTNPCSEQPLPFYGSCNLGSINLNHPSLQTETFDFTALRAITKLAVRYLDLVGSVNVFPTQKHKDWYEENRPVGLGVMGVADLFLRYGIAYGSEESITFLDNIMAEMYLAAIEESEDLGAKLGYPKNCKRFGRRNITVISIAPTGSIAMIADCSHGIEPIFSSSFTRIDEKGQEYLYVHPLANEDYFVSAVGLNQPTWKQQIDLVAVTQKWCDSGVSKTINLPNSATVKDVKEAFVYAWQNKLKGITVYRDGSRNIQVLNQTPTETDVEMADCKDGVCNL